MTVIPANPRNLPFLWRREQGSEIRARGLRAGDMVEFRQLDAAFEIGAAGKAVHKAIAENYVGLPL